MARPTFSHKVRHENELKRDLAAEVVAAPWGRIFSPAVAFLARMRDPRGKKPSVMAST